MIYDIYIYTYIYIYEYVSVGFSNYATYTISFLI